MLTLEFAEENYMKNTMRIVSLVLVCLTITVLAAGCSAKGNTYVFDDFKITDKGDLSDSQAELAVAAIKAAAEKSEIAFEKDGTLKGSIYAYWKQKSGKVYGGVKEDFEISDNNLIGSVGMSKITATGEFGGVKYKIIYKKK